MLPYLGWIITGWTLTWAAIELNMLERLLDTVSLTGDQWAIVAALSLIGPGFVYVDKTITTARARKREAAGQLL